MSTIGAITSDLYRKWRFARRGERAAEIMNNPVWTHLIETGEWPGALGELLRPDDGRPEKPRWCFDRMGQTCTELPDGRTVYIAGEHEDYYDPDFYIYNDIVVKQPNGRLDILGFPPDILPPTDFHTATVVDSMIWVVGSVGYVGDREYGTTQVLKVDPSDWTVQKVETSGENPGWIAHHHCELNGAKLVITEGIIEHHGTSIHNLDRFTLDLARCNWRRERSDAHQFVIERVDQKRCLLWHFGQLAWELTSNYKSSVDYRADITKQIGAAPDMEKFSTLYDICGAVRQPDTDDAYNLVSLTLGAVGVRVYEEEYGVRIIIERDHPLAETFVSELATKLSALERTEYQSTRVGLP